MSVLFPLYNTLTERSWFAGAFSSNPQRWEEGKCEQKAGKYTL